jgi:TrmH family RNA methyltransferase
VSDRSRVLTSVRNPLVVEIAKLHEVRRRRASGRTIVEGPHQLADVLAAGSEVQQVFHLVEDEASRRVARQAGIPATAVGQSVLRRLAGTEHPRGPVAVVAIPAADELGDGDTVVLFEVRDPGNVGAIVRTAAALGYAVAATPGTADLWSPKVIRKAAATQFGMRVTNLPDATLATLRASHLRIIATVAQGGDDPAALEPAGPFALLIGNEARGLPDGAVTGADVRVTIPLENGVESLNAAVAASLVMYALRRR